MFHRKWKAKRTARLSFCFVLVLAAHAPAFPVLQNGSIEFDRLRGLRNGSIEFDSLRGLRGASIEFDGLRGLRNGSIEFEPLRGIRNATIEFNVAPICEPNAVIADAGPDQTAGVGQQICFDGSGSFAETGIANIGWDLDGDGVIDVNGPVACIDCDQPDSGEATLFVTDTFGCVDSDIVLFDCKCELGTVCDEHICKTVTYRTEDGDCLIEVGEKVDFKTKIEVINNTDDSWDKVVIGDCFFRDIVVTNVHTQQGAVQQFQAGNHKTCLRWRPGDLGPGDSATLVIDGETGLDRRGNQEYTRCSNHQFNNGALLRFADPHNQAFRTGPIVVSVLTPDAEGDCDGDGIIDGLDGDPFHPEESPPTVAITSPTDGDTFIEGQTILFSVDATDDGLITSVDLSTDTGFSASFTTPPFETDFTVPIGVSQVLFTATATDTVPNVATANVTTNVIPDPLTTIIGSVVDPVGLPVDGAALTTNGDLNGTSLPDGSFTIPDVPTILGDIVVSATATVGGFSLFGSSEAFPPVLGGVTDVGLVSLTIAPSAD